MTIPQLTPYSMWKAKSVFCQIRNRTTMPTLVILIQNSVGSPSHSNQTRKEIKEIQIGKEVKLCKRQDTL